MGVADIPISATPLASLSRKRAPKPRTRDQIIAAGFEGKADLIESESQNEDPMIRVAVLGARQRLETLTVQHVLTALQDPDPRVRKRGLELASVVKGRGTKTTLIAAVCCCLQDPDPLVVDAACWALGERRARAGIAPLITCSSDHEDPRCREAAVAALGAIGDPLGLPAILARLKDKPAVRRRVVVALASFEGEDVDAALDQCRVDHDWQVRQAVEMLERSSPLL